jgi:hypothetical protein
MDIDTRDPNNWVARRPGPGREVAAKNTARRPLLLGPAGSDWELFAEAPAPKPAAPPENRRQKWLIRIGALFFLVLLAFTLARGASEKRGLPDPLLGVWQSSDPKYANCYMEITPATIQFGNVQRGYLLYFVSSFENVSEGGGTYLIHYTDLQGVKYQMSLSHKPKPRETIYFTNQPKVLWTRRPSP